MARVGLAPIAVPDLVIGLRPFQFRATILFPVRPRTIPRPTCSPTIAALSKVSRWHALHRRRLCNQPGRLEPHRHLWRRDPGCSWGIEPFGVWRIASGRRNATRRPSAPPRAQGHRRCDGLPVQMHNKRTVLSLARIDRRWLCSGLVRLQKPVAERGCKDGSVASYFPAQKHWA